MNTQKNIITKPTLLKRGLSVPVKIRLQPIKKRNEKIMKTRTIIMTAMLFLGLSYTVNAKDLKGDKKSEVTFLVSMTCENCQKRIENKMSFEKGVTDLDVNLPQKTVTIK